MRARSSSAEDSCGSWSAGGNQRDACANQENTGPSREADLFAQDVLCAKRADHVAERRRRNHQTDGLPGKQYQQRVKRKRHQRHARPEPAIAHCSPQELKQLQQSQTRGFTSGLHSVGDGDLAPGAAENQNGKCQNDPHHATASLATAVVRGFVCPTNSTPTQISATPNQRRGETDSCKKTTASKVSRAYPNAPAGIT